MKQCVTLRTNFNFMTKCQLNENMKQYCANFNMQINITNKLAQKDSHLDNNLNNTNVVMLFWLRFLPEMIQWDSNDNSSTKHWPVASMSLLLLSPTFIRGPIGSWFYDWKTWSRGYYWKKNLSTYKHINVVTRVLLEKKPLYI